MAGMILRKTGVVLLTILERAASCGTYDIETVVQGIKVVSAPACTGRKSGTIPWSVCLSVIRKGGVCYVQI